MTMLYKDRFEEIKTLGSGGFSTVFEAKSLNDRRSYAVKKISLEPDKEEITLKEVVLMIKLESDFVVKYFESWIESNYYAGNFNVNNVNDLVSSGNLLFDPHKSLLLHIQMELCPLTLRNAINEIKKECLSEFNTLSTVGFYISCEILIELLESVQFLHLQSPPIIHRDLKPENILITEFTNNRFIRLTDFGLSTYHEFTDQSHTKYKGTTWYKAPELSYTGKYSSKVDMFSIGIIMQELFIIDLNSSNLDKYSVNMKKKVTYLEELLLHLLSPIPNKRPDCSQILNEKESWNLSADEISQDIKQIFNKKTKAKSASEYFIHFFIQNKFKYDKRNITKESEKQTSDFSAFLSKNEDVINEISLDKILRIETFFYELIKPKKFEENFTEICCLGEGAFGTVFKVVHKNTNKDYALKRISFKLEKIDSISKEFQIIKDLDNKFVVKFYDAWIEENYNINSKNYTGIQNKTQENLLFNEEYPLLLHILLEVCPLTLKDVLTKITSECLNPFNKLSLIGYYIASELFIEVLESIEYLHKQIPQIIHRDLKPDNILISFTNNRFVKLSDFGLSTYHEFIDQSHSKYVGTVSYRSNDLNTRNYSVKADIDSLGLITEDIFNFKIARDTVSHYDSVLIPKMTNISTLIAKLRDPSPNNRPHCSNVLDEKDLFTLNDDELENKEFQKLINKNPPATLLDDEFIEFFVQTKSRLNKLKNERNTIELQKLQNTVFSPTFLANNHYKNNFNENAIIGSGDYSTVFKTQDKNDKKYYAIKKISIDQANLEIVLIELEKFKILDKNLVVNCYDSWIEENYYTSSILSQSSNTSNITSLLYSAKYPKILHIRMELCSLSLRDAISKIHDFGNLKKENSFIVYFIVTALMYELLECVNYLHKQTPKIINKCLKPENILITPFENNRCVRLSDYGLTLFHEKTIQAYTTTNRQTENYKAKELTYSKEISTKTDIYSLGIILRELFKIDLTIDKNEYTDSIKEEKVRYITKLILKQQNLKPQKRPEVENTLAEKEQWLLSFQEKTDNQLFVQMSSKTPKDAMIDQHFIQYIVENKII